MLAFGVFLPFTSARQSNRASDGVLHQNNSMHVPFCVCIPSHICLSTHLRKCIEKLQNIMQNHISKISGT